MRPQKFPNTLVSLEGNTEVPGSFSGRSLWRRHGSVVACCRVGVGNPTDRGAWWATVHGVTKNQT